MMRGGRFTMIDVRLYKPSDVPALLAGVAEHTWDILAPEERSGTSPDLVREGAQSNLMAVLQSPGGTAVVADDAGRIVGYLLIGVGPDAVTGEMFGYLADIYLDPQYRGRGIARRVHDIGEAYLVQLGVRKAKLWTHAHNPEGQASAQRNGYKPYGIAMIKELVETAADIRTQRLPG